MIDAATTATATATNINTNANATKTETSFVVTGFGPFGGVEENPTTVIVRRLDSYLRSSQQRQHQQQQQGGSPRKDSDENGELRSPNGKDRNHDDDSDHNTSHDDKTANGLSVVADLVKEYVVLETSAQGVNKTMDRIRRDCVEAATNATKNDSGGAGACNSSSNTNTIPRRQQQQQKIILLHLGVGRSEGFRLEFCAYNEASFRIPDFQGYQPWEKPIVADSSQSVGQCYKTSLDLEGLQNQMQRDFPGIATLVSTDPGRFVCNYVYCKSLEVSLPYSKGNESSTTVDRDTEPNFLCESLFLHVPHFDVVDEEEQLAYVAGLIKNLAEQGT